MAAIDVAGLRKQFADGTVAVHGLDLAISDGEFLTLLGPSGCGKSTTLRMIAGLDTPSAGSVRFDGVAVDARGAGAAQRRHGIPKLRALSAHDGAGEPRLSAAQARGSRAASARRGWPRPRRRLHLDALLDRRPAQLSGGQQQRVALGRAMIREPSVFLFDEPLSNLDAQLRTAMRAELVRIHQATRRTMIYVTHDQLEAMTMSDRIAVMHRGELQQVGTPQEIYGAPANRFVAGFVGTPAMNFFSDATIGFAVPDGALVGVRAEHLVITPAGDAEVVRVEPVGHETLVVVRARESEIVARVAADTMLRAGMGVSVSCDPAHVHLFDAASGRRVAR